MEKVGTESTKCSDYPLRWEVWSGSSGGQNAWIIKRQTCPSSKVLAQNASFFRKVLRVYIDGFNLSVTLRVTKINGQFRSELLTM